MLTPNTESALAAAIADTKGPLRIIGGGTRPIGRCAPAEVVSLAKLSGITLYEPGALTLVVQAGTPLSEIETVLAGENQRLAFEPMDHRQILGTTGAPTIGAVAACNISGPRRIAVGACRDFMLGVRFVDGRGQIIKNGGRVMKNVTGYDLVKLFAGSFGTLGVLTEVALKVLPMPETTATLVIDGQSTAQAVAAMSRALGSPFEVTGAAHLTQTGQTYIRIEGFEGSVRYRATQLRDVLAKHGEISVLDHAQSSALWHDLRDVAPLSGAKGDLWRLSLKPSDAPAALANLPANSQTLLDWGGGLIWTVVPSGHDLRQDMAVAGHATLIRSAAATLPVFHPEPAPLAALAAGLRAKFDPRGILNPGMMT